MMGTESMGVDLVLAWPTATIGQIDPERAVDINYEKELREAENPEKFREEKIRAFKEEICTVYHAGARQLVNDIVDPRSTRPMIIQALDCFKNKEETLPAKKHGNIPL
jgi:propionyl-CoA carboxylase beta chain